MLRIDTLPYHSLYPISGERYLGARRSQGGEQLAILTARFELIRELRAPLAGASIVGASCDAMAVRAPAGPVDRIGVYALCDDGGVRELSSFLVDKKEIALGLSMREDEPIVITLFEHRLHWRRNYGETLTLDLPRGAHLYHAPIHTEGTIYACCEDDEERALLLGWDAASGRELMPVSLPEGCVQAIPINAEQIIALIAPYGGHLESIALIEIADGRAVEQKRVSFEPSWLVTATSFSGAAALVLSKRGYRRHALIDASLRPQWLEAPPLWVNGDRALVSASPAHTELSGATTIDIEERIPCIAWGGVGHREAAIIMIHGGPYDAAHLEAPQGLLEELISHGFFVLQPNLPGSIGFGDDHLLALDTEYLRSGLIADLQALIKYARTIGAARVFVLGESFGGYLASRAGLALGAKEIDGLCVINGFFETQDYGAQDAATRALMEHFFGGYGDAKLPFRGELAPLLSASVPPTLLIASQWDERIDPAQSRRFAAAARASGAAVRFIEISDASHRDYNADAKHIRDYAILNFLDEHSN